VNLYALKEVYSVVLDSSLLFLYYFVSIIRCFLLRCVCILSLSIITTIINFIIFIKRFLADMLFVWVLVPSIDNYEI